MELSPYLSRVRGHTTPVARAVSVRRRLPFEDEEALSLIFTSAFKVPRMAEGQGPSGRSAV